MEVGQIGARQGAQAGRMSRFEVTGSFVGALPVIFSQDSDNGTNVLIGETHFASHPLLAVF